MITKILLTCEKLYKSVLSNKIQFLDDYKHITLDDMNEVKLLNRVDTKFVFKISQLDTLLKLLINDFDVVEIKNEVSIAYESLYFDTDKLDAYYQHHRGKGERFKIRFRNYVSSKLCFLEIKKKHKGRTIKERIKVDGFEKELSTNSLNFINSKMNISEKSLKSILQVDYNRITLVNKNREERITLDLNLKFKKGDADYLLDEIVIAELKQKKVNRTSKFYKTVKKLQIRNIRISKFCTGVILSNRGLKYNNFKEKLLYINKLTNGYIIRNITA